MPKRDIDYSLRYALIFNSKRLRTALERIAREQDRSLNWIINQAMEEADAWMKREELSRSLHKEKALKTRPFSELYYKRWNTFDLAELQLLQLGLWIIGEQNRVDLKLMQDYKHLCDQIRIAARRLIDLAPSSPVEKKEGEKDR